jgi:subtilisin family serine protease
MRAKWIVASVTSIFGVCAGSQPVISQIASNPPQHVVGDTLMTTTNTDLEDLGQQLTTIYLSLYNSKPLSRLAIRSEAVPVDVGADKPITIEYVLRHLGLFFGKTFSVKLDSLACDLNRYRVSSRGLPICTRNRIDASPEKRNTLTEHVSGFVPSKGEWSLRPGDIINIPDAHLEPDVDWPKQRKPPNIGIESIVMEQLGGCAKWDLSCKQQIARYNGFPDEDAAQQLFDPSYTGDIRLPVKTVTFFTNLATQEEKQKDRGHVTSGLPNDVEQALRPLPLPKVLMNAIGRNLVGTIRPNGFSSPNAIVVGKDLQTNEAVRYRESLMKSIQFPFRTLPFADGFDRSVVIGILDSAADSAHCAFDDMQRIHINNGTFTVLSTVGEPVAKCNRMPVELKGKDVDHGTHVLGIIAARYPNNSDPQIWGLNPYADIIMGAIDFNRIAADDKAARFLKSSIVNHNAAVVNLSFGYRMEAADVETPIQDILLNVIANAEATTLFVAAAGNAGMDETRICDIRPACFDLPNLISVAALENDDQRPTLLNEEVNGKQELRTNYGQKIHIAAMGRNVFSTIHNGYFGLMSGTSQAAPQVAAVASLLYSKYGNLAPIVVKNRLIYCSDTNSSFDEKLFGGRLNAECVLDGTTGRLLVAGGGQKPEHGAFIGGKLKLNRQGLSFDIPLFNIRTIQLDELNKTYTVMWSDGPDTPLSKLSRLKLFDEGNYTLSFNTATSGARDITARDIRRYDAPLRP